MMAFLSQELGWDDVHYWFSVFNDMSLIYVIVPFFLVELIQYKIQHRLTKEVIFDSVANLVTFGAYVVIEYLIGILFAIKLYYLAYEYFSLPHLPLNWVTIVSCVLLADFAYYWDHRMMHRVGIGWATHTVHHSSPHFNMSVAYRFGPLDSFFPLLFSVPIVMLGFDPVLVLLCEVSVQVFQTLLHTEVIKKLPKPIEFIFNTPSHHRVHHGSNRAYWDKNYAGILIIWDRLLGTFAPEVETVRYGIDKPINTNNLVVVFFHGFQRIFEKCSRTRGIKNKLLVLVKPPGWEPKS